MKYKSKKTIVNGIEFPSRKEAKRYEILRQMEKNGEIQDLRLQVPFTLIQPFCLNGRKYRKTEYIADFVYIQNGKQVVEDTKGFKTDIYKLKKKLMASIYKIEIKES